MGLFVVSRYVEALLVKHVDTVIASKRAANKWVGALRRRQSSAELNVKMLQTKEQHIQDDPETLDDLKEKVSEYHRKQIFLRWG